MLASREIVIEAGDLYRKRRAVPFFRKSIVIGDREKNDFREKELAAKTREGARRKMAFVFILKKIRNNGTGKEGIFAGVGVQLTG